jgi:hypothetical protein
MRKRGNEAVGRRIGRRRVLAAGALAMGGRLMASSAPPRTSHLAPQTSVSETADEIHIVTDALEATVRKRGYVSGVAGGSFLDRKTGFRDAGFGLDIVDWVMEPGSDETYRDRLPREMVYEFNNAWHGRRAKRCVEGPQICTQAGAVATEVTRGRDFVAVKARYQYRTAAPGRNTGSLWEQTLVFPAGKRWFISSDQVTLANGGDDLFLRIDMPGHIKHQRGDTFSEVYLSYHGRIPASAFFEDFAPDKRFNYRREGRRIPKRFIRAYRVRNASTGRAGPWLAGMTLSPEVVHEAWCHQRGYVCMIEEFGAPPGRSLREGEALRAAFIVGWFDSIAEMERVYDQHRGAVGLEVDASGWRVVR